MTNVFTRFGHYPRYESHRSQYLSLQLQALDALTSKQNQPSELYNSPTQSSSKVHIYKPLSTTYRDDYQLWPYSEMKASQGRSTFELDQVAESSVPELPVLRMTSKRYSLPNVTLPIPIRCCCQHSKQWRDPCLTQTSMNYWKNLSCCGIIHENEFD